jgi:regulator of replication initiation timing
MNSHKLPWLQEEVERMNSQTLHWLQEEVERLRSELEEYVTAVQQRDAAIEKLRALLTESLVEHNANTAEELVAFHIARHAWAARVRSALGEE